MKTKKMMAIVAAAVMAMGAMAGCGSSSAADPDKGKVYFVNNKKEIVDQLEDLADQYTKETGVQVKVLTAADGYDNTLASELAKTEARRRGASPATPISSSGRTTWSRSRTPPPSSC